MAPSTPEVTKRAAQIADIAREGGAWLEANRMRLKEDPSALARDFRRFARRALRLRTAAERPMCVAVFGASQAGKSYLVSGLATPRDQPLTAVYGGRRLNFLKDLNPPGGKESTGLVSRFTIRQTAAPAGTPVPLRLLSQTDIVKILANTFLEDFKIADFRPPEPQAIAAAFERLAVGAGNAPQGAVTGDDIEEMREYFDLHFSGHALLQALGPAFWLRAAEVIPRLTPDARADAYAPLWGGTPEFTRVARELIDALASLGFAETAFCGIGALMPRESSVLDADMVFGLGEGSHGQLQIVSPTGATASLDRSLVAALIAEITVPLAQKPWDFFDHTDLLDFPGARSREEITNPDAFLAEPDRLGRVFLRGKVAYLFQRYNAEQEIAAMLLCVGPSNQDVQTLPRMISGWIGQTLGATPTARAQQRNSLFLVLTQFDREFEEKAGEDIGSGQRWSARIQASILDFFGKAYGWPQAWVPGRAFDNTFWLRSPAIGFDAVFDYAPAPEPGGQRPELGVAPRAERSVADKRAAYLANPLVRAHFADPARSWDEALRPNDGGIGFLAECLRPVCDPALKAEQVSGRIEELAVDMAQRLRPYFHTGDLAAELSRARQKAREVLRALVECAQAQMFGPMLRALQVTPDQITSLYWRIQSEADEVNVPIGVTSLADDYLGELGDMLGDAPAVDASAPAVARDRFEHFADMALAEWSETIQTFAEDRATPAVYRLPREQAATLVGQIGAAARRLDLRTRIAADLRARASFQHRSPAAAQKPIMVVEAAINGFVYMLGYDRVSPEQRPKIPAGTRTIFAPRPPVIGPPLLGSTPAPYDRTFHVDWMTAMARMFEENVQDPSSSGLDIAANETLGKLLTRLEARPA